VSDLAAIVLAAGASTRMGRSKARLVWRGRTFLAHAVAGVRSIGCAPILVIDGSEDLSDAIGGGAIQVRNLDWRAGHLSSLQRGLDVLLSNPRVGDPPAVVVASVDRPRVGEATLRSLVEAARAEADTVWQPSFQGIHGHPIVYPGSMLTDLLGLPSDAPGGARSLLRRPDVQLRRRFLEVDDRTVVENIDTPVAFAALD
jgi:molybdenum cofactor cytidylyltransferase